MSVSPGEGWRPQGTVEILAGTPEGGGQDRAARTLAASLDAERLVERPVVVLNVPGRGGGNAWDRLASRAGDPHVLAISSPTLVTNRLLGMAELDHADLATLAVLYTEHIAFVVPADSPIVDGTDLAARLGREPSAHAVSFATNVGNVNHVAVGLVAKSAGGDMGDLTIRVFDSARQAIADLLDGNAAAAAVSAASALPELRARQLRAVGVTAPRRLPGELASVPTWEEQSVPCVIGTWRGVMGAAHITPGQAGFWEGALEAVCGTERWAAELECQLWTDTFMARDQARAFLDGERREMGSLLAELGLLA